MVNHKDIILRFLLGGTAVVLSYILSAVLPWKEFGGIFAAFPAVMIVAVTMMGLSHGSKKAAQIAHGAVYGIIGCAICVLAVLLMIRYTGNWWMSIGVGLLSWYASATLIGFIVKYLKTIGAPKVSL